MLTGSTRRLHRILPPAATSPRKRRLTPSGRVVTGGLVVVGASAAGLLGGPVAGFVCVAYLGVGAHLVGRTRQASADRRRFAVALDALADAAAALRAGGVTPDLSLVDDDSLRAQAWSALSLSERTGAPLAELLERIETQHRLALRSAARAGSEAAGAATTAVMLAALPAAGVALGFLLGVDPARILLHTPIGAACAIAAVVLQLAGLAWVNRLIRPRGGRAGDGQARHIPPTGAVSGRPARRVPSADGGGRGRAGVSGALARHMRSALVAIGAGAVLAICLGGVAGVVAGAGVTVGVLAFLLRSEPPERRRERESARHDLPLAIDLIAAALRAGAPLDHCLLAVAGSLRGPIADRLERAGRSLRLGAPVRDALRHLADLDGAARVVTAAERSSASGAALAGVLQRCAADLREADALAVESASRRAGVLIVMPLGLCFLPAFVLAGLVPVLIAFLGDLTL